MDLGRFCKGKTAPNRNFAVYSRKCSGIESIAALSLAVSYPQLDLIDNCSNFLAKIKVTYMHNDLSAK